MTVAFVLVSLFSLILVLRVVQLERREWGLGRRLFSSQQRAEGYLLRAQAAERERDELRAQGIMNVPTDAQIAAGRW